jgi:hypothetical protein
VRQQRDDSHMGTQDLPEGYSKFDKRYQDSKDFLMQQLRYSGTVQDFRTVKQVIMRSLEFNVSARTFQFAKVPIEVEQQSGRKQ